MRVKEDRYTQRRYELAKKFSAVLTVLLSVSSIGLLFGIANGNMESAFGFCILCIMSCVLDFML